MVKIKIEEWDPKKEPTEDEKITLTNAAVAYIKERIQKRGKGEGVRLCVQQKGCNGWMCHIEDLHEVNPDKDWVFPHGSITLAVEKAYFPAVKGMEIDFVQQGLNRVYSFNNPNAVISCGCGESFSIEGAENS